MTSCHSNGVKHPASTALSRKVNTHIDHLKSFKPKHISAAPFATDTLKPSEVTPFLPPIEYHTPKAEVKYNFREIRHNSVAIETENAYNIMPMVPKQNRILLSKRSKPIIISFDNSAKIKIHPIKKMPVYKKIPSTVKKMKNKPIMLKQLIIEPEIDNVSPWDKISYSSISEALL